MIMLGVPNMKAWGTSTSNLIWGTQNPIWGTVGVPVLTPRWETLVPMAKTTTFRYNEIRSLITTTSKNN